MKRIFKRTLVLSLTGISILLFWGCTDQKPEEIKVTGIEPNWPTYILDKSDVVDASSIIGGFTTWDLSDREKERLINMRQEEKLARDVYTTLGERWGKRIFPNILISEDTHATAIKNILTIYGIPDPVVDETVWVFPSPAFKKLYDDLIAQWSRSLLDALVVGASIEDIDINDLRKFIQGTKDKDIIAIYENLKQSSYNHLRAFVQNIKIQGGSYTPKHISQQEFDEILSSSQR